MVLFCILTMLSNFRINNQQSGPQDIPMCPSAIIDSSCYHSPTSFHDPALHRPAPSLDFMCFAPFAATSSKRRARMDHSRPDGPITTWIPAYKQSHLLSGSNELIWWPWWRHYWNVQLFPAYVGHLRSLHGIGNLLRRVVHPMHCSVSTERQLQENKEQYIAAPGVQVMDGNPSQLIDGAISAHRGPMIQWGPV